jgi:hypothetical protein
LTESVHDLRDLGSAKTRLGEIGDEFFHGRGIDD